MKILQLFYALTDTKYKLIENDMTASFIHSNASEETKTPERGDLIFMGEENSSKITHIAIYDREENGNIYFIDSTEKPFENINGVTERFYKNDDKRFKSYGIMKLKY